MKMRFCIRSGVLLFLSLGGAAQVLEERPMAHQSEYSTVDSQTGGNTALTSRRSARRTRQLKQKNANMKQALRRVEGSTIQADGAWAANTYSPYNPSEGENTHSQLAVLNAIDDQFMPQKEATSATASKPIVFCVLGDTPYRQKYKAKVAKDMANLPSECRFAVHVGDTNAPKRTNCEESWFKDVHLALRKSRVPVLVCPGDNDIQECPVDRQHFFHRYFVQKSPTHTQHGKFFNDNWNKNLGVTRQTKRTENWSFEMDGALFIGLNMVRLRDDTAFMQLLNDNIEWVMSKLENFRGHSLVVFGHHRSTKSKFKRLREKINAICESRGISFLYMHGNGHSWEEEKDGQAPRMLEVQVRKGSREAPVVVKIQAGKLGRNAQPTQAFEFDRKR